jgi:hypothetical protein
MGAQKEHEVVIRRLGLFWKRFTSLEVCLFAEVRNVLPKDARLLFDAQVAAINHVRRLPPSWSEIDFYADQTGRGFPQNSRRAPS